MCGGVIQDLQWKLESVNNTESWMCYFYFFFICIPKEKFIQHKLITVTLKNFKNKTFINIYSNKHHVTVAFLLSLKIFCFSHSFNLAIGNKMPDRWDEGPLSTYHHEDVQSHLFTDDKQTQTWFMFGSMMKVSEWLWNWFWTVAWFKHSHSVIVDQRDFMKANLIQCVYTENRHDEYAR